MFFLLDICDENVRNMPYFVYSTPPAKQHKHMGKEMAWIC